MHRALFHIWSLCVLFFLAAGASIWLVRTLSPQEAKLWQFAVFYAVVFLSIFSFTSLVGFGLRISFWRQGERREFLRSAERHGVLLGFLMIISLMLSARGFLNIWTGALLLLIFILIELYAQ